jgi:hypothetical protein
MFTTSATQISSRHDPQSPGRRDLPHAFRGRQGFPKRRCNSTPAKIPESYRQATIAVLVAGVSRFATAGFGVVFFCGTQFVRSDIDRRSRDSSR